METAAGEGTAEEQKKDLKTEVTEASEAKVTTVDQEHRNERRMSFGGTSSVCNKCRNSFKSCEFCQQKKSGVDQSKEALVSYRRSGEPSKLIMNEPATTTYNPVYNIREIRTVCHSFSSLGIDKKLLDIQMSQQQKNKNNKPLLLSGLGMRRRSVGERKDVNNNNNNNNSNNKTNSYLNFSTSSGQSNSSKSFSKSSSSRPLLGDEECLLPEQVNANGKFLYI